jgi:hypothetical protein
VLALIVRNISTTDYKIKPKVDITYEDQQFSYLAKSFLEGKLYFLEQPGKWDDTAPYEGKYYWPLGPFPAVLLVPFVYIFDLFDIFFKQLYLQVWLIFGIFCSTFILARRNDFSKFDSAFLAIAFFFSFLGVMLVPTSWPYAQVVTTFLLFLSILEYTSKKRYWMIGSLMGLVLITRMTAALGIIFFCFDILHRSKTKIKDLLYLLAPFGMMGLILATYNFARFENIFEQGYSYQLLSDISTRTRDYGLFGFVHLPANLYYFLLSGPLPVFKESASHVLKYPFVRADPWGMSVLVTSPYFLYLFFQKYYNWESKSLLVTALFISVPMFLWYSTGYMQFGYRLSLDFFPFLHFLLISVMEKKVLSKKFKLLILTSACFNTYLFWHCFDIINFMRSL